MGRRISRTPVRVRSGRKKILINWRDQLAGQLGIASALAIPDQTAIPLNELQEVGNPTSDGVEDFEDTALASVGYEGYSTDEDEASALVAESGKKQLKLRSPV